MVLLREDTHKKRVFFSDRTNKVKVPPPPWADSKIVNAEFFLILSNIFCIPFSVNRFWPALNITSNFCCYFSLFNEVLGIFFLNHGNFFFLVMAQGVKRNFFLCVSSPSVECMDAKHQTWEFNEMQTGCSIRWSRGWQHRGSATAALRWSPTEPGSLGEVGPMGSPPLLGSVNRDKKGIVPSTLS